MKGLVNKISLFFLQVRTSSAPAPGLLQRLGRVLKEKASGDFERFFKGTVKTRERLGVSLGIMVVCMIRCSKAWRY